MNFKNVEVRIAEDDSRHWKWTVFVDRDQYARGQAPQYLAAVEAAWAYVLDLKVGAHW
jgi:hypothetical protein